jgi:hypothetical protein
MMIRGDWRSFYRDSPPSRPFRTAVALVAAVVFGVICVADVAILLAALTLRLFDAYTTSTSQHVDFLQL